VGWDQHLQLSVAVLLGEPGVITRLAGLTLSQSRARRWLGRDQHRQLSVAVMVGKAGVITRLADPTDHISVANPLSGRNQRDSPGLE
jgi:hypothetical protein